MQKNVQLPDQIAAFLGKKMEITLASEGESEQDNLHFIDWAALQGEEDADDLIEYFLNDECLQKIEAGELWPFAVLGLMHNPYSFQEMGNNGLLLIELNSPTPENPPVIWLKEDVFTQLAPAFSALQLSEFVEEENSANESGDSLETSPWKEIWDESVQLAQGQYYPEAIEKLNQLLEQFPEHADVDMALSQVYASSGLFDKATFHAMRASNNEMFEVKYQINVAQIFKDAEQWPLVKKEAEIALTFLSDEESDKKQRAQCFALIGMAHFHLGDVVAAAEFCKKAVAAHSMVFIRVSGLREVMQELGA